MLINNLLTIVGYENVEPIFSFKLCYFVFI